MSAGVLTVAGVKYAAGLYWQPSPDGDVAKSARIAAQLPSYQADFFCVRPPKKVQPVGQFGLGVASAGHRAGMPSLAACLANQVPGSWAGAFRADDGVYFIAVRDDLVDPDGDAAFTNEFEAQARLEQEISRGGFANIYCPSEWGVSGSQPASLPLLLTGYKGIVLQNARVPKSTLYGILVLLVIGALSYGGYLYWQHLEEVRQVEEAAAAAALAEAQRKNIGPTQYPKTWQDTPHAMDYLQACGRAMEKLAPQYLGWSVGNLTCSGTQLTVAWTHTSGNVGVVPAEGKASVDPTLSSATTSLPLEGLKPRGTEKLAYYGLIDEAMLQNNWPFHLTLLPDDPPPVVAQPTDGSPPPPPPPPPPWRKRGFTVALQGAPWLRPDLFDIIPGLIITSVEGKIDGNYTVEGTIYENKQP